MTYNDESNVTEIVVTNTATGGRETFADFDELADAVAVRGHDLIQTWGGGSSITLRFDVKYAEPEPEPTPEPTAPAQDVSLNDVHALLTELLSAIRG
jgi:hypothetical protein